VVEHEARLDILRCLADGEPLALAQVSSKTGMYPRRATHHLRILDSFGLVGETEDIESGQALYTTRLADQPDWVREIVEAHQSANKEQ
jgi:DNA-binding transcriptional ArsR family regulator